MASKMQNWIEHQERHLSADDFAAWKASDVKVQNWLAKRQGISAAEQKLDDFNRDVLKKVMAPAIQRASDWLANFEKTAAAQSKETGTLTQAIGSTKAKLYPATFCGYVASGPRRGFARVVEVVANKKGKQRLKRLSEKGSEAALANSIGAKPVLRNPLKYARLLMRGRKALVRPKDAGPIPVLVGGKLLFRRRVKEAPAHDFMKTARLASDSAANMAQCEMALNLQKLLPE